MSHLNKENYLFSIDAIRLIAILAVILIHSTTTTLQLAKHDVDLAIFPLILNQASRFAVPLFFLISGFVLELSYRNSFTLTSFIRKRAFRIVLPFFLWSVFYTLAGNNWDTESLTRAKFLTSLINGSASYHLYFVPTLITLYLLYPAIHKNIKFISKKPVLIAFFILHMTISFIDYYIARIPLHEVLRIAFLCMPVFTLGMIASHHKDALVSFATKKMTTLFISLILLATTIVVHVDFLTLIRNTTGFIYNQYGPLNFMYTLLLALVLFTQLERVKIHSFVLSLSRLSFFVFFIHVFIQFLVVQNITRPIFPLLKSNILLYFAFDVLQFLLISIVSFGIAYVFHRIPNVSKITG